MTTFSSMVVKADKFLILSFIIIGAFSSRPVIFYLFFYWISVYRKKIPERIGYSCWRNFFFGCVFAVKLSYIIKTQRYSRQRHITKHRLTHISGERC